MQLLNVECTGSMLKKEMLTSNLTVINQMKVEVDGEIQEMREFLPANDLCTSKVIAYVKGGTVAADEIIELKRFLAVFGGTNERQLIEEYGKIYGMNITEDEVLTIQKLNDFAEYLLDEESSEEDGCFRVQRKNGAKLFTKEGNFEVTLNRHNYFRPTIAIEKNGVEKIYFAKNAATTESILSTWFAN